jgi:hypothetical protein
MTAERVTLYEAVQAFMGPIVAEYGRIVEDGQPDMPVRIILGGYTVEMTLADLQRLDRAYAQAFDQKLKRDERKARGTLL